MSRRPPPLRSLAASVTPADGRTRPAATLPPSIWMLPDPSMADRDGVVGVGADLAAPTLVDAYREGIFPWPHDDLPLPWFSPDPRGVLEVDAFHRSRSLRATLRRCGWTATVDRAFGEVMRACGEERLAEGTWITPAMLSAYSRLHDLGWAHSVEIWDGAALVGGVYGVQLGAVFTGESMFHRRTDASKVALLELCRRFAEAGGQLIDVQIRTDHLATLGVVDWERRRFLDALHALRDTPVRMLTGAAPVARWA